MTQTVLLGDLLTDLAMGPFGSNLKVDNFIHSGVPVVKGGNLYGYEVGGDFSFVSEEKAQSLKRSLAYPDDIIITHRGTLGQVSIVPHEKHPYYLASQSQLRMTPDKNKINPRYLLYYLRSSIGQHELMQHAAQVGVPSIATPTKAVKSFKILLPDLETQQKIVDTLGVIDEKIELNRRMNAALEQTGHALFRHYFIDNPEAEKWEEGKLGELTDINKESIGKNYPYDKVQYVDISSVSTGLIDKYETIELSSAPSRAKRLVHDGDIIWATVRPNRRAYSLIMNPAENTVVSTGFAVLSPKENALGFVYYHTSSQSFTDYLTLHARGAAYPAVTASDFKNAPVIIPDTATLKEFNELVLPSMLMIGELREQTQTLTTLRDTLLPRLINGRVQV